MENERVREGGTIEYTLIDPDVDEDTRAATVTLTISQDDEILKDPTANFALVGEQMVATVRVEENDLPLGDYEFMFTVVYEDGFVAKIPNTNDCNSDEPCELPILTVCDANDVEPTS